MEIVHRESILGQGSAEASSGRSARQELPPIVSAACPAWVRSGPRALFERFVAAGARGDYRLALVARAGSSPALRARTTAFFAARGRLVTHADLRNLHPALLASAGLADVDPIVEAWSREPFEADLSDAAVRERRRRQDLPLWSLGRSGRTYVVLATAPCPAARAELERLASRLPADLDWQTDFVSLEPDCGGVGLGDFVLVRVRPHPHQTFLGYRVASSAAQRLMHQQRVIVRSATGKNWQRAIAPLKALRARWEQMIDGAYVTARELLAWEDEFHDAMRAAGVHEKIRSKLAHQVRSFLQILGERAAASRHRKEARRAV